MSQLDCQKAALCVADLVGMTHPGWKDPKQCAPFETRTEAFPMQQTDELQVFHFREPILCVGGRLKVSLSHESYVLSLFHTQADKVLAYAICTPAITKATFTYQGVCE